MQLVETYKEVKLTGNRTSKIIDELIKIGGNVDTIKFAKQFGLSSRQEVIGMLRTLYSKGIIEKPDRTKKIKKTEKIEGFGGFNFIPESTAKFGNYNGSGKKDARKLIVNVISNTNTRNSNILTLPAKHWKIEKALEEKRSGYNYTAVEYDKKVYKEMVSNVGELFDSVISFNNCKVSDLTEVAKPDTYSSAILDYCGFIDTFFNEINDIMHRNLVKKNGYITITLAANDRAINNPIFVNGVTERALNLFFGGEKKTGMEITTFLIWFLIASNPNYEQVDAITYRDTTTNMLLYVIQRVY